MKEGDQICLLKEVKQVEKSGGSAPNEVVKLDASKIEGIAKRLKDMIVFENEHMVVISKNHGVPA